MKLAKVTTQSSNQAQRHTQADLVLAILQVNGAVTTDQLHALGVKAPSAVIYKLRCIGYDIRTKFVARNRRLENPFRVKQAEYRLYCGNLVDTPPLFVKRKQEAA